ncbi:hypothetical protein WA1_14595 [Scytonema hofmannii PCC 7110]|uniref:Uncharacterized protein n=1 Tax=Scytonema hofmannii PCC 7110 TaxID=128403 RepID=A0A139XF36_9CYAN|nr:effector-associated domain EAD1-containing protein [Scytonema hofmannii]KYC43310.1 hypothetical protein WA1_14595 [Scytonema hofmannii PCC 7110]
MELIGKQREQLKDALISAFPDKSKLEQMVDYQLHKSLNAIAGGNTLVDIVYNLIKTAESEGWVEKLIKDASDQNSGNKQLKEFRKQYDAISELFNILIPLEKSFFHEMTQAYRSCRNIGYEDWEDSVDTFEKILTNLIDMPEANTYPSHIVKFVAQFLILKKNNFPSETADKLRDWGKSNNPDFLNLLTSLENKVNTTAENALIPTYLLVQIKKSRQGREQHYNVMAWFIADECYENNEYKSLNIYNEGKEGFKLRNISRLLEDLIAQINKDHHKGEKYDLPIIVFFLSHDLLVQESNKFEWSEIQEFNDKTPIGKDYQVVIRSCERSNEKYNTRRGVWRQKWEILKKDCTNLDSNNFIIGNCSNLDSLAKNLFSSHVIGVTMLDPPSKKHIDLIHKSAVPVAIWLRKTLPNINCKYELEQLLQGKLIKLPEVVKQKRADALGKKKDEHIGYHIALQWENPEIQPPDIKYQ